MGEARRRKMGQGLYEVKTAQSTTASKWALASAMEQERLEALFRTLGIDFSKSGFQDSTAFLAVERRRPEILDDYARYVEVRSYTDAELLEAQRKIEVAAEVVSAAVTADGRHGLCLTASGVLSRILDELGVWNFCAKATMTVTFPPDVSREKQFFFAIDTGKFEAPHAVVVAPPFLVVDTTASAQSYQDPAMGRALPPLIAQRRFIPYRWKDEDIAAPLVRMSQGSGFSVRKYLQVRNPQMLKRMEEFSGRVAEFPGGSVAYVVTGVGGYSEKLADLDPMNTMLAGKTPQILFRDEVLPRLAVP